MSNEPAGASQVPFSPEDIDAHAEHDHLAAVFADREHAAAAVDELRALGLGSDHLGIAVHGDESVVFEHNEESELWHDTEVGVAAGASIGVIAGIGLAALAVPGIGVLGLGGILAFTGASAIWGGVLGGYFGAAVGESGWEPHQEIGYTALGRDEVLVVVCSHGHGDAARKVFERHDGRPREVPARLLGRAE